MFIGVINLLPGLMGGKRYGIVKNPHWMKVAIQGSPKKKMRNSTVNPLDSKYIHGGPKPNKNDQLSDGVTIRDRMELAQLQTGIS